MKKLLPWMNSTLLQGDIREAVTKLKAGQEKYLVVLGSGELIRTLMKHPLIDQYVLLIHPLVLGPGRRLFADGMFAAFQLVDIKKRSTGVVMATYINQTVKGV